MKVARVLPLPVLAALAPISIVGEDGQSVNAVSFLIPEKAFYRLRCP